MLAGSWRASRLRRTFGVRQGVFAKGGQGAHPGSGCALLFDTGKGLMLTGFDSIMREQGARHRAMIHVSLT